MSSCASYREEADAPRARRDRHPPQPRQAGRAGHARDVVVLLLLVTAVLLLIVTIGGWSLLEGALPIQIVFILVYLLMAYYAGRWSRGVLPVGSALAVLLAIFALVAAPGWFDRNKAGFAQPTPERRAARRAHAADRPRADPARRVRDARLQTGLERRARAARPGGRGRRAVRATTRPDASAVARPDRPGPQPGISSRSGFTNPYAAVAER